MGRLPEPPNPGVKNGCEGGHGAEMEERLQRARRGMRKVKEDSLTKTSMGGGGGVFQGRRERRLEAATVKSGGVKELSSSSTANPRLRDEGMNTKCV